MDDICIKGKCLSGPKMLIDIAHGEAHVAVHDQSVGVEPVTITVSDIFAFLNRWFASDLRADFDGLGGLGVPDIFAFLNAWFAGC